MRRGDGAWGKDRYTAEMRFGIDFGTTHTVVALVDRGNYPVVSFDGVDFIPSIVSAKSGELRFRGGRAGMAGVALVQALAGDGARGHHDPAGRRADLALGSADALSRARPQAARHGVQCRAAGRGPHRGGGQRPSQCLDGAAADDARCVPPGRLRREGRAERAQRRRLRIRPSLSRDGHQQARVRAGLRPGRRNLRRVAHPHGRQAERGRHLQRRLPAGRRRLRRDHRAAHLQGANA